MKKSILFTIALLMISSFTIFANDNNLSDPPKKPTFSEKIEIIGSLPTLPPPSTISNDNLIQVVSAKPNIVINLKLYEPIIVNVINTNTGAIFYSAQYGPTAGLDVVTIFTGGWNAGSYKISFSNLFGSEIESEYIIIE